jgi:hypothetical protein
MLGPARVVRLYMPYCRDEVVPTGSGWGSERRSLLCRVVLAAVQSDPTWFIRQEKWFRGFQRLHTGWEKLA